MDNLLEYLPFPDWGAIKPLVAIPPGEAFPPQDCLGGVMLGGPPAPGGLGGGDK